MRRIKLAVAALLIALTTWYYALVRPPDADTPTDAEDLADTEEIQPITPVYDDSHEIAALNERRRAHLQHLVRKRAEAYRVEAERKRKQAALAAPKPVTLARNKDYVGQAQTFQATAYTAYCEGCSGITRTGHDLRKSIYQDGKRVIATDPRLIPLGSIVRVTLADGTSFEAVASDTGGAIKGVIIDIAHESKAEALQFGRQTVEIRMIRRGK